jgi:hypothetical protein
MKTSIKLSILLVALLTGGSLYAVDFADWYSEPKKTDLLSYLVETVGMTERLAAGDEKVDVTDLRNRIADIYWFYKLRFAPAIESRVIANLKKALENTKAERVKSNIKEALDTINEKRADSYKDSLEIATQSEAQTKTVPNHSPDPTPASVTPAAVQPSRQP